VISRTDLIDPAPGRVLTEIPLEPLVSVVIPSYNRAHVLAETLESVLTQSYPHLEIIVVDDGSTDDTAEVVRPYLDRITYLPQQNQGLAAARNTGLLRSRGEYVAWLDSDDLWNSEKLGLQIAFLRLHPDHVLVASDFSAFDAGGFFELSHIAAYYAVIERTPDGLAGFFPQTTLFDTTGLPHLGPDAPATVRVYHGPIYQQLVGGNCLHPPTVVFRRDAAMRAGLLDAAFRRDSDYEYFLRLSRQGPIAYLDRPLVRYRYSADQMSSDKHLADIALSRLLVLDSLKERDPALLDDRGFQRRLGYAHLAAADALAEGRRVEAARHLVYSLRRGYLALGTARTLAKVCLPRWMIETYRRRRPPLWLWAFGAQQLAGALTGDV
jgi:glycosyltransferase involved in cell wall biosynthesis